MARNSNRPIRPEELNAVLSDIVQDWADECELFFFAAIDDAAEQCNETIKTKVKKGRGVNTGGYVNAFRVLSKNESPHHHKGAWYVEEPHYRLTHLLENGHLTRNGTSRTKVIKHIKYGRQIAETVLERKITEIWQGRN